MNKSKIEWCDYTWNPVVGCKRGCSYCYARRFAERGLGEYGLYEKGQRFQPRYFPERVLEPLEIKKPSHIFVCSMGELFGPWVPLSWQHRTMETVRRAGRHTFMFLTKYPENLAAWNPWPHNCWVGATATDQASWDYALEHLRRVEAPVRYVSLEPLLDDVLPHRTDRLNWVIVGAQTGPGAWEPWSAQVDIIIDWARYRGIPVFLKDNLHRPERIQEWPKGEA